MTIKLRDYLAAHAPADPQSWFQPTGLVWSVQPTMAADLDDETRFALEQWKKEPERVLDLRTKERGAAFIAAMRAHWAHNDAERAKEKKLRLTQWPYAWADAVLAASNGHA